MLEENFGSKPQNYFSCQVDQGGTNRSILNNFLTRYVCLKLTDTQSHHSDGMRLGIVRAAYYEYQRRSDC